MSTLADTAPAFVDMAHRIVWCTVATVDTDGKPRTRILHPIWEWDEDAGTLTGWIATSPNSPKAKHLAAVPELSLTYWDASHDTATADCTATFVDDKRAWLWDTFKNAGPPVGYDPAIIPQWENPDSPEFGALRLDPHRLRVMPGSLMLKGQGELLTWKA